MWAKPSSGTVALFTLAQSSLQITLFDLILNFEQYKCFIGDWVNWSMSPTTVFLNINNEQNTNVKIEQEPMSAKVGYVLSSQGLLLLLRVRP